MSNDMVRELFRSLENTLYERLRIIEDILAKQRQEGANPHMGSVETRLHEIADHMERIETHTMAEIHKMNQKVDRWLEGMSAIENDINALRIELRSKTRVDDRPVEAVQAELEKRTVKAVALDTNAASQIEVSAKKALARVVETLPSPIVVNPEDEEEEEIIEEEVEEEVVEEEVEEEEEEEALTEFNFKGKTYYHDSEYKVYIPDEDGAISEPVGIYDPKTGRIRRIT